MLPSRGSRWPLSLFAGHVPLPRRRLLAANSFRTRPTASRLFGSVRRSNTRTGDNDTGHISAGLNEGIFFLDGIFPLKLRWLMHIPFTNVERSVPELMQRVEEHRGAPITPMSIMQRSLPKDLPVKITEIIPRVKEGGSFVKFSHEPHVELSEIESTLRNHLAENPVRPFFSPWARVRAFLVRGRPWIEDLYRFPTPKIKVEFIPTAPGGGAAELSQEALYSIFRRYGKIADIVPQSTDSKIVPKYAQVNFRTSRDATAARNCMHGFILSEAQGGGKAGTVLKIGYEQIVKAHWIRDWITNHPRIVIPIVAALLATVAVAVFDPIRTFFIKAHITKSFHISDNKLYKWLISELNRANIFRHRNDEPSLDAIMHDREKEIEQIRAWLMETADTFIIVQGPRGAGKKELVVDQVLEDRKVTLILDCKPIQDARGDSAIIRAAAQEVGYRPVFSWMNSISSLVDLAAQGTIGTKTGFSETLDTQLASIWQNTAVALKEIALEGRHKDDQARHMSDDEYLEAHPERRPVVVIDNYLYKSQESTMVYDKLAEWAAGLTTSNIAHVIFLTTDVSFSKSLSKALPDRVFRQVALADCSNEVAKRFVLAHIGADAKAHAVAKRGATDKAMPQADCRSDLSELDGCIATLGGRLTDLEFLARRIKAGETPNRAVREIIEQSASEILKMYILDADHSSRDWTPQAAWYLVKLLADKEQIRYNQVLLSDTFKSDGESILRSLEQAEMISIASANGRPYSIKPGKPVYRAAFRRLTEDRVLKARLDLAIFSELTKMETQNIDKYEGELNILASMPRQPAELGSRIQWLLGKLQDSQAKIEKYEQESGALKKVLAVEY